VIATDPARHAHAALEAVPAYVLLHDPTFRTALADYGGPAGSVLEPVEWQDLAEAADPAGSGLIRSPAALLRARRQSVPFRGRTAQLEQLTAWCAEPGFGALLLHGPGGQGKTRLAQHLANTLTAGKWSVLWLRPDTAPENLAVLAHAAVPLLVIVDYAETRTAQLTTLLEAAARHIGSRPLKLLLVARTAGDWWHQLQAQTALAEELLDGAPTLDLPPLEPVPGHSRTNAYHQAVHAYAAQLTDVQGLEHHDWHATAAHLTASDPDHGAWGGSQGLPTALTLHMSALADLLDTAPLPHETPPADPAKARDDTAVEDRLLKHEERYWFTSSTHLRTVLADSTLTDTLAGVFLAGADTAGEADDLLARLPALKDQPRDRRNAVRDWIAALYPPTVPGRPWDTLQPDRLAERFIGRRLLSHPAFHHQLDPHLTTLCVQHADTLTIPAIEVASQTEAPQPLLNALQVITSAPDATLSSLTRWAGHLPDTSHNLAPFASHLTQLITSLQREHATKDPDHLPDLAMYLNNLSVRLAALGRREEAQETSTEAAGIYRELARTRPAVYQVALEHSLGMLSSLQEQVEGRPNEKA
jgi:hypothetical protein